MVSKTEEEQVYRLENQVENGGGGAWEYLCLVRKFKLRRSDKVLKHGFSILNDPKKRSALGPEEWTLYEQVAVAAMDCQRLDLAKECVKVLQKKFPESKRVGRLESMLLEIFMADLDAWRELAEIYVSQQMYKQAANCFEELILSQPTMSLYHLVYADVLYTLGGLENLHVAKKYYTATIDLTGGKNVRALFGICLCSSAIGQLAKACNKEDNESLELQSLSVLALEKFYKQQSPAKISLLSSMLRSLKVSS